MTLLSGVYHFFRQRGSCHSQHAVQSDSPGIDSRQISYFLSSDSLSTTSSSRSGSFSSDLGDEQYVLITKSFVPVKQDDQRIEKKGFFKRMKEYFLSFRPRMRLPSLRRSPSVSQEKPVSLGRDVMVVGKELDRVRKEPKLPKNFEKVGF